MADIVIKANSCKECGHSQKEHADNHGCKVKDCNCNSIGTY